MSDFFNMRFVKRTRIQHKCELCDSHIRTHSEAFFFSGRAEGSFFKYYLCPTCKTLTDEFPEVCYDWDGCISNYDLNEHMLYRNCETVEELLAKLREERDNAEKQKQKTDNLG